MVVRNYNDWYLVHKEALAEKIRTEDHRAGSELTSEIVRYSHLRNHLLAEDHDTVDIIIACDDDGELDDMAEILIKDYFAAHPEINLLYADEDRIAEDGVHLDPWFKSEWAPDTFLSTFYFGNVIAFRMSAFAMINPGRRRTSYYESESALREDSLDEERARTNEDDWPVRAWIYGTLCLKIAQADGGYTRRPEAKWNEFPIGHVPEVLFHGSHRVELWNGNLIKESLTGRYSVDSAYTDLMNDSAVVNCYRITFGNNLVDTSDDVLCTKGDNEGRQSQFCEKEAVHPTKASTDNHSKKPGQDSAPPGVSDKDSVANSESLDEHCHKNTGHVHDFTDGEVDVCRSNNEGLAH